MTQLNPPLRKPYIEVMGFEDANEKQKKASFDQTEIDELMEVSRRPNIADEVASSIAPAIWGNEDIKKAIACLLFGGSQKLLPDGMKLRGDINVLLLG